MKTYGILTRFGDYFEVTATDADMARDIAGCQIALNCISGKSEDGDAVHQVQDLSCPIQGIRDDLAEIMAS